MSLIEITSFVSMLAFVGTAIFVFFQLRHMNTARNVEISMKLFEWAENERLRKAMRWIEREFQFTSYEDFLAKQQEDSLLEDYPLAVLSFFEQVGILVAKKFVNFDIVVDHLGFQILRLWDKLSPLIFAWREATGDIHLGEHFEFLTQHCQICFRKYYKRRKKNATNRKKISLV